LILAQFSEEAERATAAWMGIERLEEDS